MMFLHFLGESMVWRVHQFAFGLISPLVVLTNTPWNQVDLTLNQWISKRREHTIDSFPLNTTGALTLFRPYLVTWRSYKGWCCPWPVGIGWNPHVYWNKNIQNGKIIWCSPYHSDLDQACWGGNMGVYQSYIHQVLQTLTLYCGTHIGLCVQ